MKCPKEIRQCPNGWEDCSLCANLKACEDGTYVPETELEEPELEVDLGIVIEDAVKEMDKVPRMTWFEKVSNMSEDERWAEHRRYHPPDLISKEPITCMGGPTAPGGGGKCRVPKKPQRKVPEYMKILGM